MREPLVLLPGTMCDARIFGPQIKALGRERAMHIAPVSGHETVEALAENVLAGAPERFALAGTSLGGMVAMEIVRRAPTRVTRLALMDTSALAETPAFAAMREPKIARVMAGSLVDVIREEVAPDDLAAGAARQSVLDLVLDMALELGEGVFLRQSRALQRRPDQQGVLRKMRLPTLILCGAEDRQYPVARHQFMADLIFGAKLAVIPEAGLLPTLEQPEAVNAALVQWLES
ncbi:alpha/beta fold hydrolase [Litoreibacter arenae]|uniref:Hydrolase, alpha/beta hydrolase fold family n=1 Tax=Litoreibacter arenae DSM 19593 TaxID=1123360 RepID=S9RPK9_9RHOB|nr:alpha/beta hydrolase [Litoreibacter arenae]EPX80010.1 Hydrolase, alpha/beta hydrolase fold family [Litoreibacter arenae DSM 19593]